MAERLSKLKDKILNYWSKIEKKKQKKIVLLAILFAIALSITGYFMGKTQYTVLYSDLSLNESGEILTALEEMNVKAKIQDSSKILVDEKEEENVRMQLSLQGYPKSGTNYDLYMESINFTTSSQDKKVMLIYQLQDRLSNTISRLSGIDSAIVTISMEDESVFQFDAEENSVSANVVLELENNFSPDVNKTNAIKRLMVTSINGLKEENVAIIDSNLNNLLPESTMGNGFVSAGDLLKLENEVEKSISEKVLFLFEPVFGKENINVAVNATVDLDKEFTEAITYTPVVEDEGIPVVIDELSEKVSDSSQNTGDVAANYQIDSASLNNRVQKVVNYRVNELKQTIDRAQGGVKDISLSVLINQANVQDESLLEDVKQIVSAAVGIKGESITVGYMNFTAKETRQAEIQSALEEAKGFKLPFREETLIIMIGLVFAFVLGILILKQFKPSKNKVDIPINQDEDVQNEDENLKNMKEEILNKFNKESEDNKVIKEIEAIIESNPDNIANIISSWLSEEGY